MDAMDRTYLLLKPMATGASGFARLERHADRTLIQWQGKGLRARTVRVFASDGAGAARELGVCAVDAHGQASLLTELSSRQGVAKVSAVFAVSDEAAPKPLLLGVRQSGAGALLEARNAMLSLCARLSGRGESAAGERPGDGRGRGANDAGGRTSDGRGRGASEAGARPSGQLAQPNEPQATGDPPPRGLSAAGAEPSDERGRGASEAGGRTSDERGHSASEADARPSGQVTQPNEPQATGDPPPRGLSATGARPSGECGRGASEADARPSGQVAQPNELQATCDPHPRGLGAAGTEPTPSTPAPTREAPSATPTQAPTALLAPLTATPPTALAPALLPPPARFADEPTPEVFLPAIDPTVYVQAMPPRAADGVAPPPSAAARERTGGDASTSRGIPRDAPLLAPLAASVPPLDRPRPLRWPQAMRRLAPYFDEHKPFAPFDAPGWRFVRVPMGDGFFAVGRRCRDGAVREVLYAVPGARNAPPPRELRGYRFVKAPDGQGYWVCRQAAPG